MNGAKSIYHLLSPLCRLTYSLTPDQMFSATGIDTDYMCFLIKTQDPTKNQVSTFQEALKNPNRCQFVSLENYSATPLIELAHKNGIVVSEDNGLYTAFIDGDSFTVTRETASSIKELIKPTTTTKYITR